LTFAPKSISFPPNKGRDIFYTKFKPRNADREKGQKVKEGGTDEK